jgi:hypothetical protein
MLHSASVSNPINKQIRSKYKTTKSPLNQGFFFIINACFVLILIFITLQSIMAVCTKNKPKAKRAGK